MYNAIEKEEVQEQPPTVTKGFAFTTTNFDDGWNCVVKENWVEVINGNSKAYNTKKDGCIAV